MKRFHNHIEGLKALCKLQLAIVIVGLLVAVLVHAFGMDTTIRFEEPRLPNVELSF